VKRCVSCEACFEALGWECPECGFAPETSEGIARFCTPAGKEGFDPDAFDQLADLEALSFWFRSRNRLIAWSLQRYFPEAKSLLELGCGTGFVLAGLRKALPQLRLVGGELHANGLEHAARRLPEIDLLQFDARQIPFAQEFDVVGAFDVLEHIVADDRVLAEMRMAVRPGGGIVVTVPQHPWLWSASDDYAEHKRRYRRNELMSKVSAAGFELQRVTSFVTLLFPAMVAMRVRSRLRVDALDPTYEHAAAQRVAAPLERMLSLELALIARGIDFPIGGSLLIVARRSHDLT
jgi:SAM-dependent methyltransferase